MAKPPESGTPMRVAVFASGGGTNLQAVLDGCRGDSAVDIVLVCSDRSNAGALERASAAGISSRVFRDHSDGSELLSILTEHNVDLVVLAGYLRLVPRETVAAYDRRMINIHPALLPSFGGKGMYGLRVHRAVLDAGSKVSGPTIHLVTSEYDRGAIVAQWPVPVHADDTPESLAARVLEVEHKLLPAVVKSIARRGTESLPLEFNAFQPAERPIIPHMTDDS